MALWGCLLRGVVLVPIDYRASVEFLHKVAAIVDARAILTGDTVGEVTSTRPVWPLAGLTAYAADASPPAEVGRRRRGRGDLHLRRHLRAEGRGPHPPQHPREHRPDRTGDRQVPPLRAAVPADPLPEPAAAQPHVRPGDGRPSCRRCSTGVVVFTRTFAPDEIASQIRTRRISVLVCVPKMLEVLRDHLVRTVPETAVAPEGRMHWTARWWRYRRAHRTFGLKFWAIVVGAAPLDPELEAFWGRLGFLVVQGYGLTETAPIVTLNHPLHASRGAVGRPISGVEVRIAEDGEILVRGDNVTRGYFNAPEETREAFRGRLVPHRRHRQPGRRGTAAHPRTEEGDDRNARRAERLSRRRRAGAERAAGRTGVGRRRRPGAREHGRAGAGGAGPGRGRRRGPDRQGGQCTARGPSEDPPRGAGGRAPNCRAPREPGS